MACIGGRRLHDWSTIQLRALPGNIRPSADKSKKLN